MAELTLKSKHYPGPAFITEDCYAIFGAMPASIRRVEEEYTRAMVRQADKEAKKKYMGAATDEPNDILDSGTASLPEPFSVLCGRCGRRKAKGLSHVHGAPSCGYCAGKVMIRRAPAPKGTPTGRNQPCPCGSGKKFKHCHAPMVRKNC